MDRRRGGPPPAPKPFGFVEIAPLERGDRQHPAGHDRYLDDHFNGVIEAVLIVATPVHVGSGGLRMTGNPRVPLVRSLTRVRGRPAIPASTLKGLVRSTVEAISRSCVRITRARRNQLPQGAAPCRDKENLCVACRMFGSLGYQGLVRFSDAVLDEGQKPMVARMPSLFAPRSRTGVYYGSSNQVKGRKVYQHGRTVTNANTPVEVLRPESTLAFQVQFDNLTKAQVGLLLTGMGLGEPELILKVGGGKPACYGSVMVQLRSLQVWGDVERLYSAYDVTPDAVELSEFLAAAKNEVLILPDQLRRLAELLAYDSDRECPSGVY
jgi:hypothetical protein